MDGLATWGVREPWQKVRRNEDAARAFLHAVEELCHILEIPTLEEYGIDRERYFGSIDKMAEDAMLSGSPSNTRKQLDSEDLKNIYRSSLGRNTCPALYIFGRMSAAR